MNIEAIFKKARRDLFYPPIGFELRDVPKSYIDFSRKRYVIVLSRNQIEALSDKAKLGLLHHELNHWVRHPYDAKTVILELHWLKDWQNRELIRNAYDDVVVNLDLIEKGLDEITYVYREVKPITKLDHIIRALLSELTGLDFGYYKLDDELKRKLVELAEIDYLDTRRIVLKNNIRKFAQLISDVVSEHKPFITFTLSDFPWAEVEKALKAIAMEFEKDEFKRIAEELRVFDKRIGIDSTKSDFEFDSDVTWYLARAMNYVVKLPCKATGSLYPTEIKDFNLQDPIDSYNPVESYGKLIPGIAKKFEFEDFEGFDNRLRDAVIIIDSSGSMRNPNRDVSYAVLGAFAIAKTYLENGGNVGVVNFSGRTITLYPTKSIDVFKYLKTYQGSGTTLDLSVLRDYIERIGDADYILITDAGLQNIQDVLKFFSELKLKLKLIWIKTDVKHLEEFRKNFEMFKSLRNVEVFEVEREEDIPRMLVSLWTS
jgi:hypothetical protein